MVPIIFWGTIECQGHPFALIQMGVWCREFCNQPLKNNGRKRTPNAHIRSYCNRNFNFMEVYPLDNCLLMGVPNYNLRALKNERVLV